MVRFKLNKIMYTLEADDRHFLQIAIEEAMKGIQNGEGGPFGAVIVKNDQILVRAHNRVIIENDPTAHAEIVAIRLACKTLKDFQLSDCVLYTSCEPCPMCLGAIYWARPSKLVYCSTRLDAAAVGFDDAMIYEQLLLPSEKQKITTLHLPLPESNQPFTWWAANGDKTLY